MTLHCGKAPAEPEKADEEEPTEQEAASAEAANPPPRQTEAEGSSDPCQDSAFGHIIEVIPKHLRAQGTDVLRDREAAGSLRIPALMEAVERRRDTLKEASLRSAEPPSDTPIPPAKAACVRIEGSVSFDEVSAVVYTLALSEMYEIALTLHRGDSPPAVQLPAIPVHLPRIAPRGPRAAEEAPTANGKLLLSADTFRSSVGEESTAAQPFEGEAIGQTLRSLHARAKAIEGPLRTHP